MPFSATTLQQAENIISQMRHLGLKLVTAESCTGGLLGALFTEIAGSSDVYERGFITYSNAAKIECLGVDAETINNFGAVSPQTAEAMAIGAIKKSQADISISITGIAGPGGGSLEKPVGLVYIGVCNKNYAFSSHKIHFTGSREMVRLQALEKTLDILNDTISKPRKADDALG